LTFACITHTPSLAGPRRGRLDDRILAHQPPAALDTRTPFASIGTGGTATPAVLGGGP
jgi:hypothetical protein